MKQYLKYRCWDWILCILISIGMIVDVLSGFEIDDVNHRMPMLILLVIILTCVCFLFSINKKTSIAGILVGVVALIAVIVMSHGVNLLVNDKENSTQIFYIVIVAVSVAVFLICRSRLGIILLFLVGNIIHGGAAFLQFPVSLWAYVLFLVSCGLMLFYKVYVISVMKSHTGKIRFKGFMLQNICVCLAALMLSCGVYAGMVKPLNPPTQELKLIQKLMSFEILERVGVSQVLIQVDNEKISDQTPEDQIATDQTDQTEQMDNENETEDNQENQGQKENGGNLMNSMADLFENAQAISYEQANHWYLWVILLAACICFAIWLKKYLRKRWLAKIDSLPSQAAVLNFYQFFLFGLARAGCKKSRNLTLPEFVRLNEKKLEKFDEGGVSFAGLTEIYQKAFYGQMDISKEEYQVFLDYYSEFHKKIIRAVGRLRYLFLYFRL